MAKMRLDADAVVEDAFYTVDVKLVRKVKTDYGNSELATTTFKVPLNGEEAGGALFTAALLAIRTTFTTAFGPVVPPPPVVEVTLSEETPVGDDPLTDMPF